MAGEWQGNVNVTLLIIGLAVSLGWIPFVALFSLLRNGKCGFRAFAERRGWVQPPPKEETRIARQQKAPYVPKPQPVLINLSSRSLGRSMSSRSKQSVASWDPVERCDTVSSSGTGSGPRNHSQRSSVVGFMPFSSPASSVRSAGSLPSPGQGRGRTLFKLPPDMPAQAFQINDTYYDTTPLPKQPPSIAASCAKSLGSRSQVSLVTVASAASDAHGHRDASLVVPPLALKASVRRMSRDAQKADSAKAESSKMEPSRAEPQDSPMRPPIPQDPNNPWAQKQAAQSTPLTPTTWLDLPHAV